MSPPVFKKTPSENLDTNDENSILEQTFRR